MTNNSLKSQFYKELNKWVKEGCPEHSVFTKNVGICSSYGFWLKKQKLPKPLDTYTLLQELEEELKIAFQSATIPFNESFSDFIKECENTSLYSNRKRINWIAYKASEGSKKC